MGHQLGSQLQMKVYFSIQQEVSGLNNQWNTEGTEAFALYGPEYKTVRDSHGAGSPDATPLAMTPAEVALVVFAMCTPMANFMQGETVDVNGGILMITQERPFSFTVEGCVPGPKKD